MGKNKNKNKDEIPNPTSVTNRDILQRLSFLYQASVLLNGLIHSASFPHHDASRSTESAGAEQTIATSRKKKRRRVVCCGELSRSYVETMKTVGQKTNVKMDPSVKRSICKRCSAPLIPGISATVRIRDSPSHGHLIAYQCLSCQEERRIPAPSILHADPQTNEDTNANQGQQPTDVPMTSDAPGSIPGTGGAIRSKSQHTRKKKRGSHARLPPHFARDIGHVVFRGNERLVKASSDP